MKTLPSNIQEKLQPRVKVIYATRRAVYEVVEEVSNGIFWLYIIGGAAYNVAQFTELDQDYPFWVAVGIVMLLAFQHALLEIMLWKNEIYVVVRDEVNGGGRIYKFWGWLTKRYIDEAITAMSPAILPEQHWYFRLWGWLTGEQMIKIKLASANHVFIEGRKVTPELERAIKFVRGYRPPKEELPPTSLANLGYLHEAKVAGLIRDERFIENAAKQLVANNIYGE